MTSSSLRIRPFTAANPQALPPAAWPLPKADWEQYVNTAEVITFTAKVPLADIITRSAFGLAILMEDAFNKEAILERPTFSVVGLETGGERSGLVYLQVVCKLYAPE